MNAEQLIFILLLIALAIFIIFEPLLVLLMILIGVLTPCFVVLLALLYSIYRRLGDGR